MSLETFFILNLFCLSRTLCGNSEDSSKHLLCYTYCTYIIAISAVVLSVAAT